MRMAGDDATPAPAAPAVAPASTSTPSDAATRSSSPKPFSLNSLSASSRKMSGKRNNSNSNSSKHLNSSSTSSKRHTSRNSRSTANTFANTLNTDNSDADVAAVDMTGNTRSPKMDVASEWDEDSNIYDEQRKDKLRKDVAINFVNRLLLWLFATLFGSWVLWSIFCMIDLSSMKHPSFQKCSDLTIVAELSTYNATSHDAKSAVAELAIQSWLLNTKSVLVLVDDAALCGPLQKRFPSLKCIQHNCNHQDYNIPTVPCLLMTGEANAISKYILFTNGDIIFSPLHTTFAYITEVSESENKLFVLTGQRIDVHAQKFQHTVIEKVEDMLELAKAEGELHGESAIDYFIYPKKLSFASKMPPFLLGNWKWDNWLLHDFIVSNRATVIDTTGDIDAVHVGSTSTSLGNRPGALYNSRVFESSTFGLQGVGMGTFRYADARIKKGKLLYNKDFEIQQTKFIFSKAKLSETLIVVTVPCGFVGMLKNWLTWAQRANLENYVIFAMDKQSYNYIKDNRFSYVPLSNPKLLFEAPKVSRNHAKYQQLGCHDLLREERLLIERNHFLQNISSIGIGFVSMSVNSIVLEPFRFGSIRNKELFGQRLVSNTSIREVSDGFWGVSPTFSKSAGRLLGTIIGCQELAVKESEEFAGNNSLTAEEQEFIVYKNANFSLTTSTCRKTIATKCLNQEIKRSFSGGLSILSETVVAGGVSTFIEFHPQRKGVYPSIVHQDIACEYAESVQLLSKWNLWVEKEKFSSMMPYDRAIVDVEEKQLKATAVNSSSESYLVLRILTMNRPEHLNHLLASVKSGNYENDTVDIEIHIDYPHKPTPQSLGLYGEVQDVVYQFQWPFGEKRIVDPGKHRGLFNMWIQPFIPRIPGQVVMVLEDDNELSPVFYSWCKALLQHFKSYKDPKLYGFSLQRQHSVIGLAPNQKYPMTFIDLKMDQSKPFYRYQLLSSWGTLLFPAQWNNFVAWAVTVKSKAPNFDPCIPYFFNNIWYIKRPDHIWTIWFNYYIYMHGMYSIYINYARFDEDGRYFSLLKNHRAQGLHFEGKKKKDSSVVKKPDMQDKLEYLQEPPPKMLLPPTSYPLYDFHLQFAANAKLLEHRWRLMSGINLRCVTNHPEKKSKRVNATVSIARTSSTKK